MGPTVQIYGFPTKVTAEDVKIFLETHTGDKTIRALKIKQSQNQGSNPRAYAIVQYTDTDCVTVISAKINANERLYYGNFYLKIYPMERDIIPKPNVSMLKVELSTVHFGNQVSKNRFLALWKGTSVAVNFGAGLRKMEFLLTHCSKEYRLEFSYDNIWQIQLQSPWNHKTKFLLIQVTAAPRIYEKPLSTSTGSTEGSPLTYFMDTKDEQWVRTTDFTPGSCIGQSTAVCLEFAPDYKLPRFRESFYYYKEVEGNFHLESGSPYSSSLDHVPIVHPPQEYELPFGILFKINALVQSGYLAGPNLDASFYDLVNPKHVPTSHIERALDKLYSLKECCYEPTQWLNEQYKMYRKSKYPTKLPVDLNDGIVSVRRVEITPSKVYFYNPEVIVSNRVLRNYTKDPFPKELIDNFIRVSFVDEDGKKMWSTDLSPRTLPNEIKRTTDINKRILSTLKNGIVIGDKRFEFLAYSSSQLRDNSLWMFAPGNGVTAASIREWMGDFRKIRNVAKYASRLGQSFSSSKETLTVYSDEMEIIKDIKVERDGVEYTFSDGIGKISSNFAERVAKKCGIRSSTPSAFQVRYGGYKGVVGVDPKSVTKLSLRLSMRKYISYNTELDVLSWTKFQPCYLNRQIITLLSTLGVKDEFFQKKQREVVNQLDTILTDSQRALEALEVMSPGESINILREMLICGYKPDKEPYLSMMLQTFRKTKLLELRKKSRIFIPDGRALMGCLDETRTLEYGEVFIQVSCTSHKQDSYNVFKRAGSDQRARIIDGTVVVAKNPCLHPGDVRVLRAVNVPALHHMMDCVVFPQKGIRPHPNECSGSDLDGDIYFVCWDPELIPPREAQPMDYTPAPPTELDHIVTMEEVQEYFTNYMVNDSLGTIANAHTVLADKDPSMAECEGCLELARLFSIAVDFPKTGVPAKIPSRLYAQEYPDFMEKPDKPTYESTRVIGKLFREVKDIVPHSINSFTWEVAKQCYDRDMEVEGFEYYLDEACNYKERYDLRLGKLMDCFGMKNEGDLLARGIVKTSINFNRKQDMDAIGVAIRALRKEVRSWLNEKGSGGNNNRGNVNAKASSWYHVTYHPNYWGRCNDGAKHGHFLSFPWCVYDKLINIKRENSIKKPKTPQSFEDQFRHGGARQR
ncbi:RNA-directed RNA polymerase [Ranunculus cassubicifolius]